jgi:putative membrane protein
LRCTDLDRDILASIRQVIHGGIDLRGFIVGTVVTAIAFWVLTNFLPGFVSYKGALVGLLVLAVIFGVVNGLIGPIVRLLALPLRMMTLGLVGFLINAALLLVTAAIADLTAFHLTVGKFPPTLLSADTLVSAIVGAIVLSVVSTVVRMVVHD